MDQHPVAVDIANLEVADLRGAQSRPIGGAERRPILQARRRSRYQQVGNLLDTQRATSAAAAGNVYAA